jgi:hypothetical protein
MPATFCARTVIGNSPASIGVPVIAPVWGLRDKPCGNLPLTILHVIGAVPLAERLTTLPKVVRYGRFLSPTGSVFPQMIGGSPVILIVNSLVVWPTIFSALAVNVNSPLCIGVPDMTPVCGLRDNPGGNAPLEILQVIGVVPLAKRFDV